jgi:hypothetical protein
MNANGAHAREAGDTTGPLGRRQAGRLARGVLRTAAAITLIAGVGVAGLAAAGSPALAATSTADAGTTGPQAIDPSCSDGTCTQTFTSSGTFTTADLDASSGIQFTIVGAAGGDAGAGGLLAAPGNAGGLVTTTYAVPSSWEGFAAFQVNVGGVGGDANSQSGPAGGAGGAGGGGAGGGAICNNPDCAPGARFGLAGVGGGGGGGATAVYASDSTDSGNGTLVGIAPGGGGAAVDPSVCAGGNAGTTSGGSGGCAPSSCQNTTECLFGGGNGTAGQGGAGATAGWYYADNNPSTLAIPGGGGGGGGLFGGGGGGVQANSGTGVSGPGGMGSSNLPVTSAGNDPAEVIVTWQPQPSTQTTVSLSSSAVSGGTSVTATADVQEAGGGSLDSGSVQFAVDGYDVGSPEPVSEGGASITLPPLAPGNHQVTASYNPTLPNLAWSTSAAAVLTVQGQSYAIAVPGSPGPMLLEVNGTNGGTDLWQQVDSGNGPQANEQWAFGLASGGYGYLVNEQTGNCLGVNGTTGAVDTWACVPGAQNELWRRVPDPDGAGSALQVESSGDYLAWNLASTGSPLYMASSLSSVDAWQFTSYPSYPS